MQNWFDFSIISEIVIVSGWTLSSFSVSGDIVQNGVTPRAELHHGKRHDAGPEEAVCIRPESGLLRAQRER